MNLTRCSKAPYALALVVVLAGAVGTAGALQINPSPSQVPDSAEVGTEMNTTLTIENAFTEDSEWTLTTETELTNVSWTVEEYDQNSRVEQWPNRGGQTFSEEISSDPEGDEIRIAVTGTVPEVEEFNYSDRQAFTLVAVKRTTGDNTETLETYRVHHYTAESKAAREAIDSANASIAAAGGNAEAEEQLQRAIESYNNEGFGNAQDLAEDAESIAESSQTTSTILTYGGLGVVLLVVVVGGVWYYRKQQDDYDKLR